MIVSAGPTVLLLHGIASSSVTFHHVIPLLERTHRCIAIDLLGFGSIANGAHVGGLVAGCLSGLVGGLLARRHAPAP